MPRGKNLRLLSALLGLVAAILAFATGNREFDRASAQEFKTMDQTRSPQLEKSLEAFQAAGADKNLMSLLHEIDAGAADLGPALSSLEPPDLSRAYSPVPTRHAGETSSALVFALDAGHLSALEQMISAGADPADAGGLLALVAVRHFTGSILDRNWDMSVAALQFYIGADGNPTFASENDNLPLFAIALQNGNLPGATTLLEGGADIWAPTRRQGRKPGAIAVMDYWPATIEFMAIAAERGAFREAPKPALDQIASFYAEGYLNEDRDGPDKSFPHAGTSGMKDEPDKAALVVRLFRAIEPLAQDNPDIALVLSFADRDRQK